MHSQSAVPGGGHQPPVLVHRGDRAAGRVVGVLQAQQRGPQHVVGAFDDRRAHRLRRGPAGTAVPVQRLGNSAGQPGRGAEFAADDMGTARCQEPVATAQMHAHRDRVGHAAGRHPQRGRHAEQVGGPLLQRAHGRVVIENVITDLGGGHRGSHGRVGFGDGVGTKINGRWVGHRSIPPHTASLRTTVGQPPTGLVPSQ